MNGMRKLLGFAAIAVLAASFTTSAIGATKQFSISATGSGNFWTLTYQNGTQGGGTNSNINSVTFIPPFHVSNVTLQPSLVTGNTLISPASCTTSAGCDATTISITWMNGIPPSGGTGYVTMNGTAADTAASCSSGVSWSAQAFTGNALGGTNFQPVTATTTSTVPCILQFVTQPANAQAGTNITSVANNVNGTAVQVQALVGGAVATWFTGNITLTPTPSAPITGGVVAASAGVSSFGSSATPAQTALTLSPPGSTGTFTLTASATGFTSAISNPFKIFAGVLNCSEPFPLAIIDPANVAPDQPGYAFGNRNAYNKDGVTDGACVPVLYTFTNNILVSADPSLADTVNLTWDTQSQVNAAFQYTVNWQPTPVDSAITGWSTSPRPQVAWLDTNGNLVTNTTPSANIAWIPGLACLSDSLPVKYGSLGAAVDANSGTVTINNVANVTYPDQQGNTYAVPPGNTPNIPPVPFPIVIADTVNGVQSTMTERMTAVAIVGSPTQNGDLTWNITYQVTRGTATEGGSTIASHAAGYSVMSTPLPIIPNDSTTFKAPYKVKTQAQMCIAKHGFTSFQIDTNGNTQVMYTTTVFDIGDGWVGLK